MKKKLALLLAATMTMTLLPMNLFAATTNSITNVAYVVKDGTVFYEDGLIDPQTGAGEVSTNNSNNPDIAYALNGSSITLSPVNTGNRTFMPGDTFQLNLTNGEWFFRNSDPGATITPVELPQDNVTGAALAFGAPPVSGTTYDYTAGALYQASIDMPALTGLSTQAALSTGQSTNNSNFHGDVGVVGTQGANKAQGAKLAGKTVYRTYDTRKGLFFTMNQKTDEGVYVRTPSYVGYDPANGTTLPEVGYTMTVSQSQPNTAIVRVYSVPDAPYDKYGRPASLTVPLAVFGNIGDKDVTVSVAQYGNTSPITPQVLTYAIGGSGGTTAVQSTVPATTPIQGRKTFKLNPIVIRENRIHAIAENGVFEIQAPSGFSFADLKRSGTPGTAGYIPGASVSIESGLQQGTGFGWSIGYSASGDYNRTDLNSNTRNYDKSTVVVAINGLVRSSSIQGAININDLVLVADNDNVTYSDVSIKVVNKAKPSSLMFVGGNIGGTPKYTPNNTNDTSWAASDAFSDNDLKITSQTLLVAQRSDWTIDFHAIGTIPTLYTGRWLRTDSRFNEQQKAATIFFGEKAATSWWSQKETILSLPQGVKFDKVSFHDTDHLTDATDIDGASGFAPMQNSGTKTFTMSQSSAQVEVTSDKVTLNSIAIDSGIGANASNKGDFQMDSWLSISPDFTGPVQLTASGSGLPETLSPVTIANAKAPISITVDKVTDVKIGYQYQDVSNITITETGIGALLKGKTVKVSVSDLISTDLVLANDVAVNVTSGDMKINNVTSSVYGDAFSSGATVNNGNGNALSFDIDRVSSTSPSTIVLSNVAVKVDRDVPQSNHTPYKAVAWGSAIAENFDTTSTARTSDFGVRGLWTDFISVVSAPNDVASVLTQEVRVPIGQSTYTVNGASFDMAATAYISTKSNSAMVPLRFVAQAFGLTNDQIIWDQKAKTATLMTPSGKVIQFKAGSTDMVVNQVVIPMLSLDTPPLPVAAEFDAEAGRVYVPFRALGNAFGVPVSFDSSTNTAIYNPGANVQTAGTSIK